MTDLQLDPDDSLQCEVQALAQACLGSTATVAQRLQLEHLVQENAAARRLYVHYMHDTLMLRRWAAVRSSGVGRELGPMESVGELEDWRSGQIDNTAAHSRSSAAETAPPFLLIHSAPGAIGGVLSGWPMAYLVATVIFAVGLVVGAVLQVRPLHSSAHLVSPSAPSIRKSETECVGHVLGMVDCQWAKDAVPLHPNDGMVLGHELKLESGLVEIGYTTGATVILQGPVTYVAESSNGGFMSMGKLTGKVDHENAKGFAVRTPNATVTDLGTEFGVEADRQGTTAIQVFQGTVKVEAAPGEGAAKPSTQVFRTGQSARVEGGVVNRVTALGSATKPVRFVRTIPGRTVKTFDLVDVVAGGDGFSGRRGRGIDPTNGRPSTEVRIAKAHLDESLLFHVANGDLWAIGDGKFHRAEDLPFVDGVFIPDGSKGPITVDSAGHTFADCPTTLNYAPLLIWGGGAIPQAEVPTTMDGVDYARSGHGLLYMHANLGLSFDLDAVRKANPGWTVRRFSAMVANMVSLSQSGTNASADCWILVDGRARSHCRQLNANNDAIPISVLINSGDRFLTLVSTDGGNGIDRDLIAFGDPRLELAKENDRQTSLKSNAKGAP
jgi:hypothetical protein